MITLKILFLLGTALALWFTIHQTITRWDRSTALAIMYELGQAALVGLLLLALANQ